MDSSSDKKEELRQQLRAAALEYHQFPRPGKIAVTPIKGLLNQRDLALAYSPGVAAPCEEIVKDPAASYKYTSRGNLVAVISNGTAVLGLGNIGPLASKPVMEGKGVLFKKFAAIDVFDIEIAENDPDKLVDIIASLEPTFGGVNLEDIKAPECFYIERKLRERMKIPVFHDDQHGTAIIVGAAILNGLKVVNKDIRSCKLVVSGAGAAALACLDLIVDLGFPIENIYVTDLAGVVYKGRLELMDPDKERFAQDTPHRSLSEVIPDADIFLGLSAGGVLKPEMVVKMAPNPLILALANPNPEILPEDAKAVRSDAIIATGRSDYPNQVNNVLCFPYMFRGALDCGATTITREMEIAVVHAIADLAHAEQSDIVASAYGINNLSFGPEYLIPMPFDPRLLTHIAPAVAKAAQAGGVATRPIEDLAAYAESLQQFVYRSGTFMKPLFSVAKAAQAEVKRIVYAEGEDERVLRAVQVVVDEGLARPILVGRPAVLEQRIEKFGLRLKQGVHFDVINPDFDERYRDYWQTYHQMVMRKGVTADMAKLAMRRRHTLIGAMMIHKGDADGMICGTYGTTWTHLEFIDKVLGKRAGTNVYAAMNIIITPERQLAMLDTHVNENPNAAEVAEMTIMAAEELERFGITPRVALLSHSNFGTSNSESAQKMRDALAMVQQKAPHLEIDGEMHGDAALDAKLRAKIMPHSTLKGDANMVVMPNIESANIAYNLLKTAAGNGIAVGPILLGCARPVHILTPSATVRRIVNMTALCVVDAVSNR
ncbi:NADP-dependent malic enzyme [Massilia sp. Dwa41.01b]|uniref:NADP-dependent malic enzyme n=1 Tax=unclassified Massilia TaxID=2609279 RepID=UPI0015FF09CD|nr:MULTISPECIES: NADP-dependent malic enzyme [unclassified Massilia]QNA90539.1 NADP-dependent malic enzyme [Massilia sp. Dwa41.01b]QNA97772.1 NADP-dependent malic enzyme [Massilia sp. Se16.2.3]